MDDLVRQLRDGNASGRDKCKDMSDHFPCIEDCPCALELRVLADAARIEALEARVAAADKMAVILAEAMHEHDTAYYGYGEENPWTMKEWFSDEDRAALAAYQATKEGKTYE